MRGGEAGRSRRRKEELIESKKAKVCKARQKEGGKPRHGGKPSCILS